MMDRIDKYFKALDELARKHMKREIPTIKFKEEHDKIIEEHLVDTPLSAAENKKLLYGIELRETLEDMARQNIQEKIDN